MISALIKDIKINKYQSCILIVYSFLLLFFCSKMSPFYFTNEFSDVNVYFNVGKAMMDGRTLYAEVFDHKGPLIFFIYALGSLISSDTFFGVFLIEFIGWTIFIFAVFYTAKLFLENKYAFVVALLLPLGLIKYMSGGGTAEEFILILMSISLFFSIKYFKDEKANEHRPAYMFIHGIVFSSIFLIKLNLTIWVGFIITGIFINILFNRSYRNFLQNIIGFILGVCMCVVPIVIYFYLNNALDDAYDVYIALNSKYAGIESAKSIIQNVVQRTYSLLRSDALLLFFIALGMLYFPVKYIKNKIGATTFIIAGLSLYTTVVMSHFFFEYYPIPLLLFSVLALISVFLYLTRFVNIFHETKKVMLFVTLLTFLFGIAIEGLHDTRIDLFLTEKIKKEKPDNLNLELAEVIRQEKDPTLLFMGFGTAINLFTICDIVPNVKYFMSPNLTYEQYPQMRDEQIKYLENKEVQFFLLLEKPDEFSEIKNNPKFVQNYTLAKEIRLYLDAKTEIAYILYKRND